jgi:hypothetical protein
MKNFKTEYKTRIIEKTNIRGGSLYVPEYLLPAYTVGDIIFPLRYRTREFSNEWVVFNEGSFDDFGKRFYTVEEAKAFISGMKNDKKVVWESE